MRASSRPLPAAPGGGFCTEGRRQLSTPRQVAPATRARTMARKVRSLFCARLRLAIFIPLAPYSATKTSFQHDALRAVHAILRGFILYFADGSLQQPPAARWTIGRRQSCHFAFFRHEGLDCARHRGKLSRGLKLWADGPDSNSEPLCGALSLWRLLLRGSSAASPS